MNPLLALQNDHQPLPFDTVEADHFIPALEAALADARSKLEEISNNEEAPSFANTIEALEACDEWSDRISAIFFHLLHAHGTPELQALSKDIPPLLAAFSSDVSLNPKLFARIESLWEQKQSLSLDVESSTLLENIYLQFRRNGAALAEEQKEELRALDQEMSVLGPKFAEHVVKATQAYALWTRDEELVAALPASARETAKAKATQDERPDEWKFTLDAPSFIAFMTYAPDAELRKEMWTAFSSRCLRGDYSNLDLIRQLLTLRRKRASLLGYTGHAEFTLERRMVGNLEKLEAFYDRMIPAVYPAAKKDLESVRAHKEEVEGESELFPWDYAFYSEKLRKARYDLDQETLRPWFELEATLQAAFDLAGDLWGIEFKPSEAQPGYHPQVRGFAVHEKGQVEPMGHLIFDPHPRPEKKPGAWMAGLLSQGTWGGKLRNPLVAIVCNFTPPGESMPSLLTLDETRTLFHEFGHALHGLLSKCDHRSVAGTNVFWDFVELPSQLMENWLGEEEFLKDAFRHYESGEALPADQIERLLAAKNFQKGYQAARQVSFGKLDLSWHGRDPEELGEDLIAFENEALKDLRLFPPVADTAMSPAFQHIFSGGYSCGYYSYKWAEVLEADIFEVFQEEGLRNADTASRLREHIFSKGGSEHPMTLFKRFRGREPDPDALLRRDGLLA